MGKKQVKEEVERGPDTSKIWCPDRECVQYVKACQVNCKKKFNCVSYKDYIEPKLF